MGPDLKNYTIKKLDPGVLTPGQKAQYSLLLPPKYRCCLEGKDPFGITFGSITSYGLEYRDEPVGIITSVHYEGTGIADIYAFFIAEPHRNPELGKEMLRKIEERYTEEEATIISFNYRKGDPSSPFLENLMLDSGWSPPAVFMERYFFDVYTFRPRWFQRLPKMPPQYKLFPWKYLKKEEKEQIRKDFKQGHFSESVSPFLDEEIIEYSNSLGLRYKGKVIGWSITHRIAPDTVRYSGLYIKPEFQFRGYSIRLLIESIRLQQKTTIKWSLFELNLDQVESSWIRFVHRRLAPYALKVDKLYQTWKALDPEAFTFP